MVPNRNELHRFDAVRDQSWGCGGRVGRPLSCLATRPVDPSAGPSTSPSVSRPQPDPNFSRARSATAFGSRVSKSWIFTQVGVMSIRAIWS